MSVEHFIITVYCLVVENFQQLPSNHTPLRQRGFQPKLTDPELITMEIVGEFLGIDTDKGIWSYFKAHWGTWFPNLGSRSNFAKQAANLWAVKLTLFQTIADSLQVKKNPLHMADGFPIPICKFKRAYFSRLFKDTADYGYCASKEETYFGFKGNLVIDSRGVITNMTATAANIDERDSLFEISHQLNGLMLADKGLIGEFFQKAYQQETGLSLQTPLRKNMADPRGKDAQPWLISTRRLVETVIGQLTDRFNIQKVWARDMWHFSNRIYRKILSHTISIFINIAKGNHPLQFDKLIAF